MKKALLQYDLYSAANQRLLDALAAALCFFLAFQLRFDWQVPPVEASLLWFFLPIMMFGRVFVNALFGVYRLVWRYINLTDGLIMLRAQAAFSLILLLVRYAPQTGNFWNSYRIPQSVIFMEFVLFACTTVSVRVLRRLLYEYQQQYVNAEASGGGCNILLIGAGSAGIRVVNELGKRRDFRVVGFLDDDPKKIGSVVAGLHVLGPVESLPAVAKERAVAQVIICTPHPPRLLLKRVWALCEPREIRVRTIPTLPEILDGKVNIAAFRDIHFSDLLGREGVNLSGQSQLIQSVYYGKRILVTGAGGSIGSELTCQLAGLKPAALIALDKDENGLFELCSRLRREAVSAEIHPVVADLRSLHRLGLILDRFQPDIIFHAAAHKHVPLMELNPSEAVFNNVMGTRHLIEQACAHKVSRFVLISSDKAVKPTSIMGATKRVCEMLVQAQCANGNSARPHFACVRFGNVVGSRGSVIPLFQRQIASGGPVTVTHPDVERFFMTIPESVSLVIQAGTLASAGEIFVLDMGDPVSILNLAQDMIELSGLRPGRDIELQITQLRPGEKLKEELLDQHMETLCHTSFEKIYMIRGKPFDPVAFSQKIAALEAAAGRDSSQGIQSILQDLDIGFRPALANESFPSQRP